MSHDQGDWLDEAFSMIRSRQDRTPEAVDPCCIPWARARELVLAGHGPSADELRHVEACRRCAGLMRQMAAAMPHASFWELAGVVCGVGDDVESFAARHIETDGCRGCRVRLESLKEQKEKLVCRAAPQMLPTAGAARADHQSAELEGCSPDGSLEFTLICEAEEASLELRSRSPEMRYALVSYCLRGLRAEQSMAGYAVLAPDVEGWFAAEVLLPSDRLQRVVGGECRSVSASAVDIELLNEQEAKELAHLARERLSQPEWRAWSQKFASQDGAYSTAMKRLLRQSQQSH